MREVSESWLIYTNVEIGFFGNLNIMIQRYSPQVQCVWHSAPPRGSCMEVLDKIRRTDDQKTFGNPTEGVVDVKLPLIISEGIGDRGSSSLAIIWCWSSMLIS